MRYNINNEKQNETKQNQIEEVINQYGNLKTDEKQLKTDLKTCSDTIKNYCADNDINEYSTDKYTIKVTTIAKQDLDEDKALQLLKTNLTPDLLSKVVKTKEYIDENALEDLVYNGVIATDFLGTAITTTEQTRLTIKGVK